MDDNDPITQFFPGQDEVDLYAVLDLKSSATLDEIKKSYRRLALLCHPDKQRDLNEEQKSATNTKFQQVGFAYAVLSDDLRRARYDTTGRTSESLFESVASGEGGWEAYFEEVFGKVSRDQLDEDKARYQGSQEEKNDVKEAFDATGGSLDEIMSHIPHSTFDDEPRITSIVEALIASGDLKSTSTWRRSVKDEKARAARKKATEKEAKEAEDVARELGLWDELYGSGKKTERSKKGKGSTKAGVAEEEAPEVEQEDKEGILKALIQRKAKKMDSFFDGLAAKYGAMGGKGKKAKGKRPAPPVEDEAEDVRASPKKKSRKAGVPPPPDINDEEFASLQRKMFGDKPKKDEVGVKEAETAGGGRRGRPRKAK